MGTIIKWWNTRSLKDRRAILVLSIAVPIILGWWGITNPLLERQSMAKRVLATKRKQAMKLVKALSEYVKAKSQIRSDVVNAEKNIMPSVEKLLQLLPTGETLPTISQVSILIAGSRQNGAEFRLNKIHPKVFWELLQLIAKSNFVVAAIELGATRDKTRFNGFIRVWKLKK